jgi:hypothetical protein
MVQTQTVGFSKAIQAGLMAGVIAAVINAVLFLVASAMGFFPSSVLTPLGQPFSLVPFVVMSLLPSLVASLIYTLITRFARNPNQIFLWVAAAVFVFMFFNPFMLKGAPAGMLVTLEIMHVVVAGLCIYFLTRLHR